MPTEENQRAFAIIPAAGRSRRMRANKLLLPWGEATIIDAVIDAWQAAGVAAIVAVVHPENTDLITHCRCCHVDLVIPAVPPKEMKDSVQLALNYLKANHQPQAQDLWLLAPADLPSLSPEVIEQVVRSAGDYPGDIIVPVHQNQQGHPAAFPWCLADEVAALAANEGVNALLTRHRTRRIECGPTAVLPDIDTPGDYLQQRSDRSNHDVP